jgi:hypothetical protein
MRPGAAKLDLRGLCPLCWKTPDKRDRTLNGYHIECAKEASAIITDMLHEKRGIAFEEWYRKRYPGRPVPVLPTPIPADRKDE